MRSHGFVQGPASWSQANPLGQGWLCWLKTSLQQRRGPVCAAHTAQPPHTASAEARRSAGNPTVIFSPAQNKSFMLVLQDSDTVWKTFSALAYFFAALLDLDLFVFSTHIRAPVWVLLGSAPVLQFPISSSTCIPVGCKEKQELNLTLLGFYR